MRRIPRIRRPFSSSSSSDSDEEDEMIESTIQALYTVASEIAIPQTVRRQTGTRRYYERDHEEGYNRLYNDYFSPNPVYPEYMFRRRFRMRRHVFLRLVQVLVASEPFFQQHDDCTGRPSISALQKCTAALRIIAYGEASDRVDEYLRLSQSTARVSLDKFTETIINQFGNEYLRSPTTSDLEQLLQDASRRGFPGMIGSIDCMHWEWKNCPVAWRGQYQGRSGKATVVLEAVASHDLWIWHSFFGIPGSLNDLTVLHRSPLYDDLLNGRAPRINFVVNNNQYNMGYYLTDGIYPKWATFIQTISLPQTPKDKLFAEKQESARKDVERAFGVLQARFAILRCPALSWDERILHNIITCCIIIHNMIVEDERDSYANYHDPNEYDIDESGSSVQEPLFGHGYIAEVEDFIANRAESRNTDTHFKLKSDLIENIWQRFGRN